MANGCELREISLDVVGVIAGVWMGTRAALGWRSGANVAGWRYAWASVCGGAWAWGHGPPWWGHRPGAAVRVRAGHGSRGCWRDGTGLATAGAGGLRKATGRACGRAKRINRWERAIDSTVAGALPRWPRPPVALRGVRQRGEGPRRRHPPSTPDQRWRGLANAAARGWRRASQLRGSAGSAYQVPTERPMAAPARPPTARPMDAPI